MSNIGTYKRPRPILRVLRGYDPQEPTTRMQRVAAKSTFADPLDPASQIRSGMVVSKKWNGSEFEWVKGLVAGAEPFFALEDSLEKSVVGSNRLPGLSCAGQFTLSTGYWDSVNGATGVTDGVFLSAYDDQHAQAGELKIAASGEFIVGKVTGGHHAGLIDESLINSQATDVTVVTLDTFYTGAKAA